jgi:hypothetical protein
MLGATLAGSMDNASKPRGRVMETIEHSTAHRSCLMRPECQADEAVDAGLDRTPAVVLRQGLARSRDREVPFARAWRITVRPLLENLRATHTRPEADDWAAAFTATRAIWRDAYEHGGKRMLLDTSLVDEQPYPRGDSERLLA